MKSIYPLSNSTDLNDEIKISNLIQSLEKQYKLVVGQHHAANASPENILAHILSYYEDIIACMPGNVYWLDKNGITLGANKNVLDMFGLKTVAEFKGLSFEDMSRIGNWSKEAEQKFKMDTLEVVKTGKAKLNLEEPPIPHNNGQFIYFLSNRVPLFDHKGEVVGVVGISINITERKMMEESLRKAKEAAEAANKAKSEFLANISHDFVTPISIILNGLEAIKRYGNDNAIRHEYADDLKVAANNLLNYVQDILEVAKSEHEKLPVKQEVLNLKELFDEAINLYAIEADKKRTTLEIVYPNTVPDLIIADKHRIKRIINNLMGNAIKFTENGRVILSVTVLGRLQHSVKLFISVEDTGVGIAADKLPLIFERFTRLDPSYRGHYKGAGLGLSIVKEFVEQLQGKIQVNSELGKGTNFYCDITFKLAEQLDTHNKQKIEATVLPDLNWLKVLLVEDDRMVQKFTQVLLNDFHCQINIADTAEKAISLAKQQDFDLILLDLGLPDQDGFYVARAIREYELSKFDMKRTKISALTAHADQDKRAECLAAGMDDFCKKPLAQASFIELCERFSIIKSYDKVLKESSVVIDENDSEKIFDFALAKKLLNDSEEIASAVIDIFSKELSNEKMLLQHLYQEKNYLQLQQSVHRLKGSSSYCGVPKLHQAFAVLELALKQKTIADIDSRYTEIMSLIDKLQLELKDR